MHGVDRNDGFFNMQNNANSQSMNFSDMDYSNARLDKAIAARQLSSKNEGTFQSSQSVITAEPAIRLDTDGTDGSDMLSGLGPVADSNHRSLLI